LNLIFADSFLARPEQRRAVFRALEVLHRPAPGQEEVEQVLSSAEQGESQAIWAIVEWSAEGQHLEALSANADRLANILVIIVRRGTLALLRIDQQLLEALSAHADQLVGDLASHLGHEDPEVRWSAQQMLIILARSEAFHGELRNHRVVERSAQNLELANPFLRTAAQETLVTLAEVEAFQAQISGQIPRIAGNLQHADRFIRVTAQHTLTALTRFEAFHGELRNHRVVERSAQNLEHGDWVIRSNAQQTLAALAQLEAFHDQFRIHRVVERSMQNLEHTNWPDSQAAAQQTLAALAQFEAFHDQFRIHRVVERSLPFGPGYSDLSIGGKALLRRKLLPQVPSNTPEHLFTIGRQWLAHFVRLEALDRLAGLSPAGAELHLPIEGDSRPLQLLAKRLASGVGPHVMRPWILEGEGRQIDFRFLPAYPALFRRLLAQALADEALAEYQVVGAHYSIGLDLKGELVPLALALYYGDENYLEVPVPGGRDGVGFPGVWTYRGESLDLNTGKKTNVIQSNLHLRPIRTYVNGIPVELFQEDVDRLNQLSSAATARAETAQYRIYEQFLEAWQEWLRDQGGETLVKTVQAARFSVGARTGEGVNSALDNASQELLAAMYQTLQKGQAARRALSSLLKETQAALAQVSWGDAAAELIQSYRNAESLAELNRTLQSATDRIQQAIFAAEKDSAEERRLIATLRVLDPELAEQVSGATSGQEEGKVEHPGRRRFLKAAAGVAAGATAVALGHRVYDDPIANGITPELAIERYGDYMTPDQRALLQQEGKRIGPMAVVRGNFTLHAESPLVGVASRQVGELTGREPALGGLFSVVEDQELRQKGANEFDPPRLVAYDPMRVGFREELEAPNWWLGTPWVKGIRIEQMQQLSPLAWVILSVTDATVEQLLNQELRFISFEDAMGRETHLIFA